MSNEHDAGPYATIHATRLPPVHDDEQYLAWFRLRRYLWHPAIAAIEAHHDTIIETGNQQRRNST